MRVRLACRRRDRMRAEHEVVAGLVGARYPAPQAPASATTPGNRSRIPREASRPGSGWTERRKPQPWPEPWQGFAAAQAARTADAKPPRELSSGSPGRATTRLALSIHARTLRDSWSWGGQGQPSPPLIFILTAPKDGSTIVPRCVFCRTYIFSMKSETLPGVKPFAAS
jgi:hypothetical protein